MNNINIEFLYSENNKEKIIKNIIDIYNSLKNIFGYCLNEINIRIHGNREDFDKYLGRITELWVIGNVNSKQEIDLISEELIEKEKYHRKEEFYSLLKHELAHLFVNKKSCNIPYWLNEGIAEYLSSYDNIKKENLSIPEDFFETNITMEDWYKSISNDIEVYKISKCFILFLLSSYKFYDLIDLLEKSNNKYDMKIFNENFKTVFKKDFEEIKKEFYNLYNKK